MQSYNDWDYEEQERLEKRKAERQLKRLQARAAIGIIEITDFEWATIVRAR